MEIKKKVNSDNLFSGLLGAGVLFIAIWLIPIVIPIVGTILLWLLTGCVVIVLLSWFGWLLNLIFVPDKKDSKKEGQKPPVDDVKE